MITFYNISTAEQSILMTVFFLTLILSVISILFSFNRHQNNLIVFLNLAVFIVLLIPLLAMSDIFIQMHKNQSYPEWFILPVRLLWFFVFSVILLLFIEIFLLYMQKKQRLGQNSIKQAIDTLPSAVCYFTPSGTVKLCNLQMYRLFHIIAQRDLQMQSELDKALSECNEQCKVIRLSNSRHTYLFPDGKVWHYSKNYVIISDSVTYTEVIFSDVTELYKKSWN